MIEPIRKPTQPTTAAPTIAVAAADALGEALRRTPARPMQEPLAEESTWFGWAAVLLADVQREGWELSRQQDDSALREALELAIKHFVPDYDLTENGIRPDAARTIIRTAVGFSPSHPGNAYWRDGPMAQALREKAGFPPSTTATRTACRCGGYRPDCGHGAALPPSTPPALDPCPHCEQVVLTDGEHWVPNGGGWSCARLEPDR